MIFSQDFKSVDQAIDKMKVFNYGKIEKCEIGMSSYTISNEKPREYKNDLYYFSENENGIYDYTIENHINFFRLKIYKTYKHKMISAAKSGNLEMFIKNFLNTEKMKGFSLSEAIINGHWNIVKYLIDNYDFKNKPISQAIRYDQVEIVNNLLNIRSILPKDWLAYCIYYDSIEVAKELLLKRKAHLNFSTDELKTNWFKREIYNRTKTAEFVRSFFVSNK